MSRLNIGGGCIYCIIKLQLWNVQHSITIQSFDAVFECAKKKRNNKENKLSNFQTIGVARSPRKTTCKVKYNHLLGSLEASFDHSRIAFLNDN